MDKLFLKQEGILKKIDLDDIYYITRENAKTYFILKNHNIATFATLNLSK